MSRYQFLVVGAGFFGATIARQLQDAGKTCLVIDKNPFMGGMSYDELQEGIYVGKAGGHILHTHDDKIWQFLSQFGEIEPFINKPKVLSQNKVYSFPINMMTLHQLWNVVTPAEARKKLDEVRIPCEHPRNFEEWALSMVGREIYEKFLYNYTIKQWMKPPSELPVSIIQRLPIRLTYDENYFTTKYQGMPKEGYTNLVKNMLAGIKVELGLDFYSLSNWQDYADHLIYTGPMDRFFSYEFGELEYHTLRFEYKTYFGDFQGNAVFNHVDLDVPYIRTVEHKHFRPTQQKHYSVESDAPTVVSYDYPVAFKDHPEPYYPIRDARNSALYDKYKTLAKTLKNVTFGGRLGTYNYLDIDGAVAQAMSCAKRITAQGNILCSENHPQTECHAS